MLNMSASGIFIDVPDSLVVGAKLELSMEWTGLYHGRQTMRLFVIATVIRSDKRGVALRILSHRFRDVNSPRVRFQRTEKKLAVA
jgi:PilZ domain